VVSSGRSGIIGRVLGVVDRFGAGGEKMDARHRSEQALRNGHLIVRVLAPTEERKRLAAESSGSTEGTASTSSVASQSRQLA
jgi:hypothetical protein